MGCVGGAAHGACGACFTLAFLHVRPGPFRHRLKLTESAAEGLVSRVIAGDSVAAVARDLGLARDTALNYCYRAGVVPRYLRRIHREAPK